MNSERNAVDGLKGVTNISWNQPWHIHPEFLQEPLHHWGFLLFIVSDFPRQSLCDLLGERREEEGQEPNVAQRIRPIASDGRCAKPTQETARGGSSQDKKV
jgi:hypothetical protein